MIEEASISKSLVASLQIAATWLAFTCKICNRYKGADIRSITDSTGEFTGFFNPRTDVWDQHFRIEKSDCPNSSGETTTKILQFNSHDRILELHAIEEANGRE